MEKEIQTDYQPGIVILEACRVRRKEPENLAKEDHHLFSGELERNFPPVKITEYQQVTAYPDQSVWADKRPILEEIRKGGEAGHGRKKAVRVKEAVWITDAWSSNYFHWITDVMPRILVAARLFPGIPVVLPATYDIHDYVTGSLEAFPGPEVIWLRTFQKLQAATLFHIPPVAPAGNLNEPLIREIRKRLWDHFQLQKSTQGDSGSDSETDSEPAFRRLFISRQFSETRRIVNWESLEALLGTAGLEPVAFEHLSWREQAQKAGEAILLAGTHGAGLTNMIFMQEGGSVLELRRTGDDRNNCYFSLASALNLRYYYLPCEVDDPVKPVQGNHFRVDRERMSAVLDLI